MHWEEETSFWRVSHTWNLKMGNDVNYTLSNASMPWWTGCWGQQTLGKDATALSRQMHECLMHCQCCQCKCAHEKKAKTLPSLSFCLRGQQREREGNVHQLTRFKPTQCSGIWNPRLVLPCKCLETHDDNDARKWCIFVLWMTLCTAQWDYVAMLMMLRWKQKVCVRICKADTICTLCARMNTKVNHQQTTQNRLTEFSYNRYFTRASPGSAERERCTRKNLDWRSERRHNGRKEGVLKESCEMWPWRFFAFLTNLISP